MGDEQGHVRMVLLFRANLIKKREVEMAAVMRWVKDRVLVIWFSCSGLT